MEVLFGIQVIAHCPTVFHANKCFHYKIGSFLIIRARWHFTMVCVKLRFPLFTLQNNSENLLQVKQKKQSCCRAVGNVAVFVG